MPDQDDRKPKFWVVRFDPIPVAVRVVQPEPPPLPKWNKGDLVEGEQAKAISGFFRRHFVAFGVGSRAGWFSGIGCTKGDRYFVATAQHCLAGLTKEDGLRVLSHRKMMSVKPDNVLGWTPRNEDDVDIALVELDRRTAEGLGIEWLSSDQFATTDPAYGSSVQFCGVPTLGVADQPAMTHATGRDAKMFTPVQIKTSIVEPVGIEDRVETDGERVGPTSSLFVAFPHHDAVPDGGTTMTIEQFKGFSGAGVFRFPDGGVWSADKAQLVGIFVSIHDSRPLGRVVKAQFVRWALERL